MATKFSSDVLLMPNGSFPRGPPTRKSLWILGSNQTHWGQLHGQLSSGRAKPKSRSPRGGCGQQMRVLGLHSLETHSGLSTAGSQASPQPTGLTENRSVKFSHCPIPPSVTIPDGSPSVSEVLWTNILGWSKGRSVLHRVLQKDLNELLANPILKEMRWLIGIIDAMDTNFLDNLWKR